MRLFALHHVRDHILPDPSLIAGGNTFRENIVIMFVVRLIIKT